MMTTTNSSIRVKPPLARLADRFLRRLYLRLEFIVRLVLNSESFSRARFPMNKSFLFRTRDVLFLRQFQITQLDRQSDRNLQNFFSVLSIPLARSAESLWDRPFEVCP